MTKPVLSILAFICCISSVYAQIYSVSLKLINEVNLQASPTDIYISGGYAYMIGYSGSSGSIIIVDINDPYNIPHYLSYNLDNATLIAVYGYYAYIAERNNVIRIINFRNINYPKSEGDFDVLGEVKKMVVSSGYLYFIRKDFGLHIYDITIPTVPIFKGNQLVIGDANGLFVNNKYAYVTSATGNLTIIDITNLSNLPIAGNYNFGINFYDVYVDGKLAYIPQGNTGVQVIDVSKLPTPEWVTNIYSRKSSRQVIVSGFYTLVNDESTLQVFYNKEPKNQLYAGSFDNMGAVINKFEVVNNKYIFLCSSNNKLKVIEMSANY